MKPEQNDSKPRPPPPPHRLPSPLSPIPKDQSCPPQSHGFHIRGRSLGPQKLLNRAIPSVPQPVPCSHTHTHTHTHTLPDRQKQTHPCAHANTVFQYNRIYFSIYIYIYFISAVNDRYFDVRAQSGKPLHPVVFVPYKTKSLSHSTVLR